MVIMNNFTFNIVDPKSEKNPFLTALVLIKRILTFPFTILNSFLLSSEDICNIPEKSQEWDNIKKITFRVNSKEDDKIAELLKNGKESQSYILSVLYDCISQKNTASIFFTALGQGIHLKLSKEAKDIHFKEAQLNFKPQLLIDALKMNKNKIVKKILAQTYPSISFRRKLYLKKEYKEININYINELLNFLDGKINSKSEKTSVDNLIELNEENKNKPLYYEKIEKNEKKNYVSTRLFYDTEIIFKKDMEKKEKRRLSLKSLNPFSKNKIFQNDTLLIHIHGGAYVAGSTFGQESFLREWSKKLDIPFLGINYGLSPKHKYPEQINECFQAYMWILKNAKNELNMDINNIIISGDSAGAIMGLSLVYILITINQYENVDIKLPDLLLMEYPTTYCGEDNVTNSLILSITDLIFDPFLLKYVRDSYVGDYKNMNDPFLNPIKANEKILKYLPRTRFFFGSVDPLRDDSIRVLYPISKVQGLDVLGYEFYNYWHSFNSITPKELRKMPWDFVFTEVDEFLKSKE
jgi:hormone-sensitive lipase